jgi:hypothetical protein
MDTLTAIQAIAMCSQGFTVILHGGEPTDLPQHIQDRMEQADKRDVQQRYLCTQTAGIIHVRSLDYLYVDDVAMANKVAIIRCKESQ